MINIVDIVVLLGSIQGLILTLIILKKRKCKSHLFLALFIFSLSIQLIFTSNFGLNILRFLPWLVILIDSIPFALSPIIYFYIYYSFYRDYEPKWTFKFHMIPVIINSVFLLTVLFIEGNDGFRSSVLNTLEGNPPFYMNISLLFKLISGLLYTIFIIILINNFKVELKEWREDKKKKRWFLWLISSFSLTWLIIIILGIISSVTKLTDTRLLVYSIIQSVIFTLLIYMVTMFALNYPALFKNEKIRDKIREKLNLTDKQIEVLLINLTKLMEVDEYYTDPEITLSSLAIELNIHNNVLSFIINEKSPGNFSNYINNYRVNKFIHLAVNMDKKIDTLLNIAYESGFNSKATFNRIFKTLINMTPSEYLKKIKK